MLNPQLAQHLALLQDDDDYDNDSVKAESVPKSLPETAEPDNDPATTPRASLLKGESPSEISQIHVFQRLLLQVFDNVKGHLSKDERHDLSTRVVVVVAMAMALSVLPASPMWRGLVMGVLAVAVLVMPLDPTPFWKDDKDNKSNTDMHSCLLQRQKESRVRLSTILGFMGGPLLLPETKEEDVTLLPSLTQQAFLEDFAQQNAALVETVDQTMGTLKRATSLSLGLGWQTPASVERVELSAIGRLRRRQRGTVTSSSRGDGNGGSGGFSLSLSRLRHTLYRVIVRQKALLLAILDDLKDGIDVDVDSDESFSRDNPVDPVVSLVLLRRGRNDLVHVLGSIVDRCSRSKENLSDTVQSQQKRSMALANEARAHLLASLSLALSSSDTSEWTRFQRRVSDLHSQIEALQVALVGCHHESESSVVLSNKDGSSGVSVVAADETQAAEWWEQVNHLFRVLDSTRQSVEQEFFLPLQPPFEANLEDGFDPQGDDRSTEESEEFNAHGQATNHQTKQSQSHAQGQKTFIFSGSGEVAPQRKRVETSVSALSDKPRPVRYDPFMEQSLIHELRNHLQAMPPTEEVNVALIEAPKCCDDDDHEGAQHVVETRTSSLTGVPGATSGLLLGELKASLKSLPEGEGSLQWEVLG